MSEEQEQNENVGSSLMSALFEKVDSAEPQEEPSQEEQPQESGELSVYGLSDAIELANQDSEQPVETTQEVTEETPVQEEKAEESLSKLDKSLFKEVEPQSIVEPEQEPTEEPKPKKEPEDELSWLTPEQNKRLQLVDFAEQNFDEYKGKRSEYIQFFKDQKEYLDTRLQDDPEAALDDTDHEYQNFLKRKKPKFTQDDLERVVELRTRRLAKQEAMDELKPELDAIKDEQRKSQVKPVVDSLKEKTMSDIKSMVPDFIREKMDKEGAESAYDSNPVEYEIVDRVVTTHQKTMFAFHEISNGLTNYDPSNRDHVRLAGFLDQLESSMPDKDGKKFVNLADYYNLSAKEKAKAYTLTHEEIVDHANSSAKKYIAQELNAFESKLRKSGYTKAGRTPSATHQAPTPKSVKPQPRQGPSVATPQAESTQAKNPVLSALGL